MTGILITFSVIAVFIIAVYFALRSRNALVWLPGLIEHVRKREKIPHGATTHVVFAFVDHYEPMWRRPAREVEDHRVDTWCSKYRELAGRYRDADGHHPKHTFFYPEEEYREEHLTKLSNLCRDGFGEIEVHLHHDNDTADGLREKLDRFTRILRDKHGALSEFPANGQLAWGFIHGNWSLDNSLPDGSWCGVNNEIAVLAEMGCYADFTLPSAPSPAQTRKINSIYYAKGIPGASKSHNDGVDVTVGGKPYGDLMLIQGVLGWDWSSRKFGIVPRIENSDVRTAQPPTRQRIDKWIKTGVSVRGRPEWVFVKIHTHGTQEHDMPTLLGEPLNQMFAHLDQHYNDGERYALHYVSSREMYNIVKAAEAGESGNPGAYRDYVLAPPPILRDET